MKLLYSLLALTITSVQGISLEPITQKCKFQREVGFYGDKKEANCVLERSTINKTAREERVKLVQSDLNEKMNGKIGFVDDINEKDNVFISSNEIGSSSLFYRAYYETPGNVLCPNCELNTIYEINGLKISRVELRKFSSSFERNIKQKFVNDDFSSGTTILIDYEQNIMDYALLYCIYKNKEVFKNNKKIPLKVSITTNKNGIDKDVLAEGTITLIYKDENWKGFSKLLQTIEHM